MSFKNSTVLFSLLAVLILFNSFFIVDEREKAIVLQFGETVREDVGVGFHFKVPIIQEVKKFDARLRSLDEDPDRILTNESKYLIHLLNIRLVMFYFFIKLPVEALIT